MDPSRVYTVRSAYRLLMSHWQISADTFLKAVWNKVVPSKVAGFVWRLAQNVPVGAAAECPGCNLVEECAEHLFFVCPVFSKVWNACFRWLGIEVAVYKECRRNFLQFQGLAWSRNINKEGWQAIWYAVIWGIWFARNHAQFKSQAICIEETVELVKIHSWEWLRSRLKSFCYPLVFRCENPALCLQC